MLPYAALSMADVDASTFEVMGAICLYGWMYVIACNASLPCCGICHHVSTVLPDSRPAGYSENGDEGVADGRRRAVVLAVSGRLFLLLVDDAGLTSIDGMGTSGISGSPVHTSALSTTDL